MSGVSVYMNGQSSQDIQDTPFSKHDCVHRANLRLSVLELLVAAPLAPSGVCFSVIAGIPLLAVSMQIEVCLPQPLFSHCVAV